MKTNYTLLLILVFLISCKKDKIEKKIEENIPVVKADTLVEDATYTNTTDNTSKLIFTVQIAALKKANVNFDNIADVQVFQEDGLVKYRLGNFDTYKEARAYRKTLRYKYQGAFVQALKNQQPLNIREALKILENK